MRKRAKNNNITRRKRIKLRIRKRLSGTPQCPRVSVFRSDKYTYAQAICDTTGKTIASASTREPEVQQRGEGLEVSFAPNESKSSKGVRCAMALGLVLSERCKQHSVEKVVFDRNGYVYHGRIKAVAEGLREGGLKL